MTKSRIKTPTHLLAWCYRSYLKLSTVVNTAIGAIMLYGHDKWYGNPGYDAQRSLMPIWLWGIWFLLAGLVTAFAVRKGSPSAARRGVTFAMTSTATWSIGVLMSFFTSDVPPAPSGFLLIGFIAAIHLIASFIPASFISKEWK